MHTHMHTHTHTHTLPSRWPEDAEFAEGETFLWSVLKPCDWNQEVPMGWRYTAAELQRSREAQTQ